MVYPNTLDFCVDVNSRQIVGGDPIDRFGFEQETLFGLIMGDAIVQVRRGLNYIQSDNSPDSSHDAILGEDSQEENVEHRIYSLRYQPNNP